MTPIPAIVSALGGAARGMPLLLAVGLSLVACSVISDGPPDPDCEVGRETIFIPRQRPATVLGCATSPGVGRFGVFHYRRLRTRGIDAGPLVFVGARRPDGRPAVRTLSVTPEPPFEQDIQVGVALTEGPGPSLYTGTTSDRTASVRLEYRRSGKLRFRPAGVVHVRDDVLAPIGAPAPFGVYLASSPTRTRAERLVALDSSGQEIGAARW